MVSITLLIPAFLVQVILWYLGIPYIIVLTSCVVRAGTSPKVKARGSTGLKF